MPIGRGCRGQCLVQLERGECWINMQYGSVGRALAVGMGWWVYMEPITVGSIEKNFPIPRIAFLEPV